MKHVFGLACVVTACGGAGTHAEPPQTAQVAPAPATERQSGAPARTSTPETRGGAVLLSKTLPQCALVHQQTARVPLVRNRYRLIHGSPLVWAADKQVHTGLGAEPFTWNIPELRTPTAYARDAQGNVYIAGTKGRMRAMTLTVIKVDVRGTLLWAKEVRRAFLLQVSGLTLTRDGSLLVSGATTGFEGQPSVPCRGTDWFIAKLTPTGDVAWITTEPSAASETLSDVIVGTDGDIYARGSAERASDPFGVAPNATDCFDRTRDFTGSFVVHLSPDGTLPRKTKLSASIVAAALASADAVSKLHIDRVYPVDLALSSDGDVIVAGGLAASSLGTEPLGFALALRGGDSIQWIKVLRDLSPVERSASLTRVVPVGPDMILIGAAGNAAVVARISSTGVTECASWIPAETLLAAQPVRADFAHLWSASWGAPGHAVFHTSAPDKSTNEPARFFSVFEIR